MNALVGQRLELRDGEYVVVDVLDNGGDRMVYAEPVDAAEDDSKGPTRASRIVLHLDDVHHYIVDRAEAS